MKIKRAPVFWDGFIEYLDDNEIICRLSKEMNCDKELTISRGLLTRRQNKMAKEGLIIRYDLVNKKIEFMLSDGENWC